MKTSARSVALDALVQAGDAAATLDRAIASAGLDARDRAFATELSYGTLKMRRALEWSVQQCSTRPLERVEAAIRWALLLGAYQLLYLDKVPAHSAVDESVDLARARGRKGATGFANAVLRRLARERPMPARPSAADGPQALGLYASLPDWIAAHLIDRFGFEKAIAAAEGMNGAPRRALRVNCARRSREELAQSLRDAGAVVHPGRFGIPECLVVERLDANGAVRAAVAAGFASWQSEESQFAVHVLDPQPGETVLDVCAGRGVKTAMIAQRMRGGGTIWSIDDDAARVAQLEAACRTSGVESIHAVKADARAEYPSEIPAVVDAALVDAPCSGLGVLGRRADARHRKRESDPRRFHAVQNAILSRAAERIAQGGRLLYVTCSTHPDEDESVVDEFLKTHTDWEAAQIDAPPDPEIVRLGSYVLTVPGIHGADGFFFALLRHRRSAAAPDERLAI